MNSLRPLVTIAILVVVGAFLYVKINEGPEREAQAIGDATQYQQPADVPPLDTTAAGASAGASAAPPWPAATTAPPPFESTAVAATEPAAPPLVTPPFPAMPELPQVSPPAAEDSVATQIPIPTQLPTNIPVAQYPDQPSGAAQTLPPAAAAQMPATPESTNAAGLGAMNLSSPPLAGQPNPLRDTAPPAEIDRYGAAASTPTATAPAAPITPIEATFAASWPTIQAALNRGELAQAHQLLSRWYDDPSLTPLDAERVETLLSQLAGTVVYSTENQLEPAHVVKPGETLETIAKQYNVPSQLLAKINGVSTPDAVRAGQELKVVRGPFSAIVDLDRKELVLMLEGRYAGKFSVTPPGDGALSEGEWIVANTLNVPQQGQSTRLLVLQRAEAASAPGQPGVFLGAVSREQLRQQGVDFQESVVALSPTDADDVADILSIGSRIVIRR